MRRAVPLGLSSAYAQCQANLNTSALKENIVTVKINSCGGDYHVDNCLYRRVRGAH